MTRRPRRILILLCAAASCLGAASPALAASPDLVISQVYGGGGNSGATYTNDYVELFNRGSAPVELGGRSLQYGSATGTGNLGANAAQLTELPSATLQPGQAFLVQEAAGSTPSGSLPTADFTDPTPINLSGSAGKVALATGTTTLGCNGGSTACDDAQRGRIIDLVGYGNANFYEGSGAAPALTNSTAATRAGGGCTDTDQNNTDFTAAQPDPRTTRSPAAPCAGGPQDTKPTVTSTSPGDDARDVPSDTTLSVTFSEPVDARDGAFALRCGGADQALTVSGGPETFTLDPQDDLPSSSDCTLTISAAAISDRDGEPDAPAEDRSVTFATAAQCGDPGTTAIPAIQGDGARSPRTTDRVSTEGVVVGDFQGATGDGSLDGFFLQDPAGDGNDRTSDGIFVFDPDETPDVQEGDVVRVSGTVAEFRRPSDTTGNSLTELTSVTVTPCGEQRELPAARDLSLPQPRADLERLEGMRIASDQRLTVTEMFNLRFGEVLLSSIGKLFQPTEIVRPGANAAALDRFNTDATILLDDGRGGTNINPILFTSEQDALRRGDQLAGPLEGVLSYEFAQYRVQPTGEPAFTERNPRPAAPDPVGGDLRAGSFNVLNYFVTFGRSEDRGADDAAELEQQEAKIVKAINGLDAHVVSLQEVQDTSDEPTQGNDPDAALDRLVAALNKDAGREKWAKSPAPRPFGNTDEIRVAQIYQPAQVERVGEPVAFPDEAFVNIARVPIAQQYRARSTGERFTVIGNHFKSKGCGGAQGADTDQGDGQSCFNATRVRQAQALLRFIAERQAATGDKDVLVLGDLNSYSQEDPIRALEDGGLTNLHAEHLSVTDRYSYVFQGRQGVLDHVLATPSLARKSTGSEVWHINADEAVPEQYDGFDELYTADPYRASDHDADVAGFRTRPGN